MRKEISAGKLLLVKIFFYWEKWIDKREVNTRLADAKLGQVQTESFSW